MSLTAAWPDGGLIHRDLMCLYYYFFIYFFLQPYSCQPSHWIINQFTADKKFILLFKIGFFFSSPSLLWGQCVNHYRGVRMEGKKWKFEEKVREEKERKRGADIHEWHKKKEELMGEKLAVSGGERERRSRGWGTAAPQITAQLVVGVSR